MKKDFTVDELLLQGRTAAIFGQKEKLEDVVEQLLFMIDLDDWTENENPEWPEKLLFLMDELEDME